MTTHHFVVGAGWALPGGLSAAGGVRLAHDAEKIETSIRMILETAPGERVMRPEFGCRIWDHLFAPLDPTTLGAIERETQAALERWEPRIRIEAVTVSADHARACAVIDIAYAVPAMNDRRHLVHPFYLVPADGADA